MQLSNQIVLVTGGGSGIGRAIAEAFAGEGSQVVIVGRTSDALNRVVTEADSSWRIESRICNVADRANVADLVTDVSEAFGVPNVLVNSAGINVANRTMADVDPANFDLVMQVNLTGSFNCMHAFLPAMRERGSGLVINVVSVAGRRSMQLAGLPYCVSKTAQSALGTYAGIECATSGVKVTNLYPGETNTPIVDKRPTPPPAEKRAAMLQPEDIAACALLVAKLPPRAVVPDLVVTPPYMMLD